MDIRKVKKTSIRKEVKMADSTHSHNKCSTLEPQKVKLQNKSNDEIEFQASKDSDWVSMIDTKTNRKYYFNVITRESQWEDPKGYCYHEMRECRNIMSTRDKMTAEQIVQKMLQSKGSLSKSFTPQYRSVGRTSNSCTQSTVERRATCETKDEAAKMGTRSHRDTVLNEKISNDGRNEAPQKKFPFLGVTSTTTPETFQDTKTSSSTDSSWLVTKLLAKPAFGERVVEPITTKTQNNEVFSNLKKKSVRSRHVGTCTSSPEPSPFTTKQGTPFKLLKESNAKPKIMNKSRIEKPDNTPSISEDTIISSSESSWLVSKLLEKPNVFRNKTQPAASSCLETNRSRKYLKEQNLISTRRNAIQKEIQSDVIHTEKETVNHPSTPSTCSGTISNNSSSNSSLASPHPKYISNKDSNYDSTFFKVATQNCSGLNAKYFSTSETWKSQRNYNDGGDGNEENWWSTNEDPAAITEPSDFSEQHQLHNCSWNRMASPVTQKNSSQIYASKWNLARHEVPQSNRLIPKDLLLTFDSCGEENSQEAPFSESRTTPPFWSTQLVYQSDNDSEDDSGTVSGFSACSDQTNLSTTAITDISWKTKRQQEGMDCNTIEPPSRLQKYLVRMEDFREIPTNP